MEQIILCSLKCLLVGCLDYSLSAIFGLCLFLINSVITVLHTVLMLFLIVPSAAKEAQVLVLLGVQ